MRARCVVALVIFCAWMPLRSEATGPPGDEAAEQTELTHAYEGDALAEKTFSWLSHTWSANVTLKLCGPEQLAQIDAYRLYITFSPTSVKKEALLATFDDIKLGCSFNHAAGITIAVNDTKGYFGHQSRLHYRGHLDPQWYEHKAGTPDALKKQIVGIIAGEIVGRFDYPFQLYEAWRSSQPKAPVFEASTLDYEFRKSSGAHHAAELPFRDDALFDSKRVTWQQLYNRGEVGRGYAAATGHILAYSFYLHRDSDQVPFYIRVVLPYDIPAAGYEQEGLERLGSKTYPVRYVELEWKLPESAATVTETTFGDNTYRLYAKPKLTWMEAKADCESRGAHLVTIESKEENEAMAALLEKAAQETAWIGLSRDFTTWQWVDFTGMQTLEYRHWTEDPMGHHNYAEITLNGHWDSTDDPDRKNAYICEVEAAGPSVDQASLVLVSAFDSDTSVPTAKYRLHVRLNGTLIYSGTPPVEHGQMQGGNISNFKDFEIGFDRQALRQGRNQMKVSLSNVTKEHWFAWDSIKIDGTPYEPSPQRWQLYSLTDVDGVYGGETYTFVFTAN
jgi:hypothetical protein